MFFKTKTIHFDEVKNPHIQTMANFLAGFDIYIIYIRMWNIYDDWYWISSKFFPPKVFSIS